MTLRAQKRRAAAGFTLVELLVAIVISLVLTLAITTVLIRTEGSKRTTTSVNDINATGSYAAFVLDRAVRSAGSGFSQRWQDTFGCGINASLGGTALLPFAAPASGASSAFSRVPATMVRLAPVVIGKDLANPTAAAAGIDVRGDVLMVMAGTSGGSEAALRMLPPTGTLDATNLRLPSGLGYSTSDLILITNVATNQSRNCLVQQVGTRAASDATQSLPLAGTYYTATGLSDYGVDSLVTKIGNAAGNMPLFNLYGVGENRTFFSYDLLQPAASAPEVAVAEGVVEMRAIYLTDPDNDGSPLVWVDPGANALFAADTLVNGSNTSQDRLRSIVAVRVGLIMRTSLEERAADYQPPTRQIILFGDTTVPQQRDLDATGEINYRFRTVDVTIPIRNVALSPLP